MDDLAAQFQAQRPRLVALAARMVGPGGEAEDAVQEAWLRLSRTDRTTIDHLDKWLTTVTSRICLDLLRARRTRPSAPLELVVDRPDDDPAADPAEAAAAADAMGTALLVVLDTLSPVERLAFVLHDLFGMPFEEIAPIVGRSVLATRQLASRGRRRVRGAEPGVGRDAAGAGRYERQRAIVAAFLTAARGGELSTLVGLLDPAAVARFDEAAVAMGAPAELQGAAAVAQRFSGGARVLRLATLDDAPGLLWSSGGVVQVAFVFTIEGAKITAIDMVADRQRIDAMDIEAG